MTVTAPPRTRVTRCLRPFIAATVLSATGDGAFAAAAPLIAASLTRDPLTVAMTSVAGSAALILYCLPAGAHVDRHPDYRTFMIAADVARTAVLALFAAAIITRHLSIPLLLGAIFLTRLGLCFFHPASQAIVPALAGTDEGDLKKVNGQYQSASQGGQLWAGPPLGSITFALARVAPVLADAVSFVASAVLIRRLPATPAPARTVARQSIRRDVADGTRYVLARPDLRTVLAVTGAYNTAVLMSTAILVLYVREVLGVPAWAYGLLLTAAATGAVAGGWGTARLTRGLTIRQAMTGSLALMGASWAVIAATGVLWVAVVLFVVQGALMTVCNVLGGTAMQAYTPGGMRGRVSAVWTFVAVVSGGLGGLLGGVIASSWGLTATLYASAGLALAVAVPLGLHGVSPRPG
jgi:MFS family permease